MSQQGLREADAATRRALQLVRPAAVRDAARLDEGFVDLLGDEPAPQPTIAQRAMNHGGVAAIYERLWRPAAVTALSFYSMSTDNERRKAATDLRLGGPQHVLDVACGPGNFTRFLGSQLDGDGLAIGFDISHPMLTRAARDNRSSHAAYVRGDARRLPFDDGAFDAVCCYAALYLVPQPLTVTAELIRVLAPGGRIAIMTSYRGPVRSLGKMLSLGAGMIGVRMFGRSTFTSKFADEGLVDIEQQLRGAAQFVTATKPREAS